MAGFENYDGGYDAWRRQQASGYNFSYNDAGNFGGKQLDFQSFEQEEEVQLPYIPQRTTPTFLDPTAPQPSFYGSREAGVDFEDEPPLLEELGIDPERILEKTLTVLNPFRSVGPTDDPNFLLSDADLAAPVAFCLALAVCLLLTGGKAHFGYVYGLALVSCGGMYILLNLMTTTAGMVTIVSVASILGYCLLPVVGLSILGLFMSLRSPLGLLLSVVAVGWCSLSASRLFVSMSSDPDQRPLLAYPCALLYGVFALIAIF